jgi:hypothetical protein
MAKGVRRASDPFYPRHLSIVLDDSLNPVYSYGLAASSQEKIATEGIGRLWAIALEISPYRPLYPCSDRDYPLFCPLAINFQVTS